MTNPAPVAPKPVADLVARLRFIGARHTQVSEDWEPYKTVSRPIHPPPIQIEAADEIERLRAALELVREYPDFDGDALFGQVIDAALSGVAHPALAAIDHLSRGEFPVDAAQVAPATATEPAAWIEHHKGGDNLVWDDPGGKKTPLFAAPVHQVGAAAPTFEIWLRQVCFQKPTTEAYDLARSAWNAALAATPLPEPSAAASGKGSERSAGSTDLTDEQIERIFHRYGGDMINCARSIERNVRALVEAAAMERAAKIAYETWEGLSDSGGDVYGEKSAAAIRAACANATERCPLCRYQHGHAIGCANNPVDVALRAAAKEPKP